MKKYVFFGVLLSFLVMPTVTQAVNHYVRAGATGANNGSDWRNAWTQLPSTLVRGDTYYIADGTYGSYIFDDSESGSTYIYIKKATDPAHGTDTGWLSSYGDGQAVFSADNPTVGNGVIKFETRYWDFDGVVGGGPSSWTSGHGFKITCGGTPTISGALLVIENSDGDITGYTYIRHVELEGYGYYDNRESQDLIYSNPTDVPIGQTGNASNTTIQYCYFHNSPRCHLITKRLSNWTVEYNYFGRNYSDPYKHGEPWADYGSTGVVFRYNKVVNGDGTGCGIVWKQNYDEDVSNWKIYGNLFYWEIGEAGLQSGMGFVCCTSVSPGDGVDISHIYVYNNTIANIDENGDEAQCGVRIDEDVNTSNVYVKNNIWINCDYAGFDEASLIHDYNSFVNTTVNPGRLQANEKVIADPFTDSANYNYTLSGPTTAGDSTIGATYNTDMLGNTRDSDSNWDRGAIEYLHSLGASLSPPQRLHIVVQ